MNTIRCKRNGVEEDHLHLHLRDADVGHHLRQLALLQVHALPLLLHPFQLQLQDQIHHLELMTHS